MSAEIEIDRLSALSSLTCHDLTLLTVRVPLGEQVRQEFPKEGADMGPHSDLDCRFDQLDDHVRLGSDYLTVLDGWLRSAAVSKRYRPHVDSCLCVAGVNPELCDVPGAAHIDPAGQMHVCSQGSHIYKSASGCLEVPVSMGDIHFASFRNSRFNWCL